jgi:uncharacterized protein
VRCYARLMSSSLFVNLPIANLARSVSFFTALGFQFNPAFTNENSTCMIVNEQAYFMLLERQRFVEFTTKPIADGNVTQAIYALSVDTRDAVHQCVDTALSNGATVAGPDNDMGFMFQRSFFDLDGHHWEVFWMDPGAMPGS